MKQNQMMWSVLAAGSLACSLCAADAPAAAKNAAKPATMTATKVETVKNAKVEAVKAAIKAEAAKVDLWSALPEVVASVNGKNITRAEVKSFLESQMPDGKIPPMFTAELLKQMAPGIVRGMVEQQLMDSALAKASIKTSAELVAAELKKEVAAMPKAQREMLEKGLAMQGSSIEKKIQEMASNKQVQKQLAYKVFLDKTVFAAIKPVTEADAKAFYDKNINQFKHDEQIEVSHILYAVEVKPAADGKTVDAKAAAAADKAALDKANATAKKLQAQPKEFENIAKGESACPSKAQGGKLPAFTHGKGMMVKEFEDAAAGIKVVGKIVGPVKTQYGYHLIRLDKITPAGVDSFDKVKKEITNYLAGQRQQEAVQSFLKKLMDENKVKYMIEMPAQM